jgi:DNA-binding NarL/FixJ family response regulator
MKPVRIIVVDDHVILRDGLVSILNAQSDFEVVGVAGTVAEALEAVHASKPDLVLMDYGLPDGTGLEATKEILTLYPDTKIVLLTVHEEDDLLFGAVRSGASGYLLKNISATDLLAKLRGLSQGDVAISSAQTKRLMAEFARTTPIQATDQHPTDPLTDRELEVLQLIVNPATNREIAADLHISIHTVKNHVHHILDKLEVNNRQDAAEVAVKKRLVSPSGR